MNLLKHTLLSAYYYASTPMRRQSADDRSAHGTEPVSILFFHRVADRIPNAWTMSRREFARQIHWLQRHFEMVNLGEAQTRIAAGRNSRPTACITFDDGYADNMQYAISLLIEQRIPFTYFVTTNHIFGNRPFPHDIESGQPLSPNSVSQLREMSAAGVEIGAHARNHIHLGGGLPRETLQSEIAGAKRDLETVLDREIQYFAFPFGQVADLSPEAFQIAYAAGYRGVCSAYGGYNFPGGDWFHLRRIHADPELVRVKNWLTVDPRKLQHPTQFDAGNYRAEPETFVDEPPVILSFR